LLKPLPGHEKLDGLGLGHFQAFLKREYRENDYLWGRLDGAERLIGLLLGADHPELKRWCARAFQAILDEEEPALTMVTPLTGSLRNQVEQLQS
jgi:Protein of unknown function (DUF3376)